MFLSTAILGVDLAHQNLPKPILAALREADAYYYAVEPYPLEAPTFNLQDASDGYRRILHLYGHVPAARAGLARCLFHEGEYRKAESEFKLAGSGYEQAAREAGRLRAVATLISHKVRGKRITQVVQILNSRLYVALAARKTGTDLWRGVGVDRLELVLARIQVGGKLVIIDRVSPRIPNRAGTVNLYTVQDDEMASADLYVMHPSAGASRWCAVIYRNLPAADCSPCAMEIAPLSSSGIGRLKVFGSLQTSQVFWPNANHGMVVVASPTFKVWWPDAYEWRHGGFVFANPAHPELYAQSDYGFSDSESDEYYPEWMDRAAIYDIHRHFDNGLAAWRRAEKACLNAIHAQKVGSGRFHDAGFYGEARSNLPEIRQRIRWILKKSYNHELLYRPYDFDLQVPPYRLGNAAPSWR